MPASARCSLSLAHFFRTFRHVLIGLGRFMFLFSRPRVALAAENLFLRKQPALFQGRKVRPRPAEDSTRWVMATLSRVFQWRDALVNVKPDTLIRWHRKGLRLFWRWTSRPLGRPRLPKDLQELARKMDAENPTWGKERIANSVCERLMGTVRRECPGFLIPLGDHRLPAGHVVRSRPVLGGLHHEYWLEEVAA